MRSEIRDLQRKLGITSIYVTHDQEEAFSIADVVAIMDKGKLGQLDTPRELYSQPINQFVAEFVGLSNLVPVELVDSGPEKTTVKVFGQTILHREKLVNTSDNLSIVLRPEAIQIARNSEDGVPARVMSLAYIGPSTLQSDHGRGWVTIAG